MRLWTWEEELLVECRVLLHEIVLRTHLSDQWKWQPDLVRGYSVRGVCELLTSQDSISFGTTATLIWHRQVSLNVSIFVWRLVRDRLPSKSNLVACIIIPSPSDAQYCMTGCGGVESAQHLFISCRSFGSRLGFRQRIHNLFRITLFNLFMQQVV